MHREAWVGLERNGMRNWFYKGYNKGNSLVTKSNGKIQDEKIGKQI